MPNMYNVHIYTERTPFKKFIKKDTDALGYKIS